MNVNDIIKRVQSKCDDQDSTYVTNDYVMGFLQEAFDWLYNAMKRTNAEFDSSIVIIPNVAAGTPSLDQYQSANGPLAVLVSPRMIRWKLPGQDSVFFRRADGPLDSPRDLPDPGIAMLDSWAWMRYSILLSKTSLALDIEVTGDFLFAPLAEQDAEIKIANNANRALASKIAAEVGKARGNPTWVTTYSADADEAMDDINTLLVKAMQANTNRVGRMSRGSGRSTRLSNR